LVIASRPFASVFRRAVEQFLDERRYLKNVISDTIEWYETAFKAFRRTLNGDEPAITKASLRTFVVKMRQRNVKAISVNTYVKASNAFCRWLHQEGITPSRTGTAPAQAGEAHPGDAHGRTNDSKNDSNACPEACFDRFPMATRRAGVGCWTYHRRTRCECS
jgi:hypothetical protein